MPRFDFKCPQCGEEEHDVWVSFADPQPVLCLNCEHKMRKLPAAPNFTVKGYNASNGYTKKDG